MVGQLAHHLGNTIDSIRRSPGQSVAAILTIAGALFVLGLYGAGLSQIEMLPRVWGRDAPLVVHLADGLSKTEVQDAETWVTAQKGVAQVQLIPAEVSFQRLQERSAESAMLLEGLTPDILPTLLAVTPTAQGDLAALEQLAKAVAQSSLVAHVDYGAEEFTAVETLVGRLRVAGVVAGLLLLLATGAMVANTIRITVLSRREEIAILQLVGATPWFIRTPFLIEGAVWGSVGAGFGVLALYLSDLAAGPRLNAWLGSWTSGFEVELLMGGLVVPLAALGVAVGVLASGWAVRTALTTTA